MEPELLTCQAYSPKMLFVTNMKVESNMTITYCYTHCLQFNSTFMGLAVSLLC